MFMADADEQYCLVLGPSIIKQLCCVSKPSAGFGAFCSLRHWNPRLT